MGQLVNMKKILIVSYSMEIGGIERSLINLLENLDYEKYEVDLLLYKQEGELFKYIDRRVNILSLIAELDTFGKPLKELLKDKKYRKFAFRRIEARLKTEIAYKLGKIKKEKGYYQSQIAEGKINRYIPELEKEYDLAISYCWPHYFVGEKVRARKKIAWIHTDYSTIEIDNKEDERMWNLYDNIISISDSVSEAFTKVYPELKSKLLIIENITSPKFIMDQSIQKDHGEMEKTNFNIVSVGRICHQKGFDNAVKAMKILKDKGFGQFKWYIVGFGPDMEDLKSQIVQEKLENSFILLGKKENPYTYMKNCNLYVQPSRYEGKAVTVKEAQILSRPVLITNYPTAPSQVEHMVDGYITENSVLGIAEGIEKLYKDSKLRSTLQENCSNKNHLNIHELKKLYSFME